MTVNPQQTVLLHKGKVACTASERGSITLLKNEPIG